MSARERPWASVLNQMVQIVSADDHLWAHLDTWAHLFLRSFQGACRFVRILVSARCPSVSGIAAFFADFVFSQVG